MQCLRGLLVVLTPLLLPPFASSFPRLEVRHYNRVLEKCCKPLSEGGAQRVDRHTYIYLYLYIYMIYNVKVSHSPFPSPSSPPLPLPSSSQVGWGVHHVIESLVGQGLLPNVHTIHLILEAAAREGDLVALESAMRLAKAFAISPDIKYVEPAAFRPLRSGK